MKKTHSRIGLISSIVLHIAVLAGFSALVKHSHSNGELQENVMSMELVAALLEQPQVAVATEETVEAPEPKMEEPKIEELKPQEEAIPEPKPLPKPKEKPKEKLKPKPKEEPKPKPVEKPKKEKRKEEKVVKALEKGPEAKQGIVAKAIPNALQGVKERAGIPNGKPDGNPSGTSANGSKNGSGSGSNASSGELNAYRTALQRALQRRAQNSYPAREKMMRKTGVVTIGFNISPSGQLVNAKVLNSSGNSNLDGAALKAANSTKVEPPPAGFPTSLTVPVRFSIE